MSNYTFSISGLDAGTTYYYRAYVKVYDTVYYRDVCSETTYGEKPTYKIINGHKFVDLGLPSGLLWATCNVGADMPADDGNYYAWGETTTKSNYSESDFFDSDHTIYSIDSKTTLEKQHDAAYVNWGSSCRMPTDDEFGELLNSSNCTWTWESRTTTKGSSIDGYKVTSVKNGNTIFLPASGYYFNGYRDNHGSCGYYWSSTLHSNYVSIAYTLYFDSSGHKQNSSERCVGHTVRPVAEP